MITSISREAFKEFMDTEYSESTQMFKILFWKGNNRHISLYTHPKDNITLCGIDSNTSSHFPTTKTIRTYHQLIGLFTPYNDFTRFWDSASQYDLCQKCGENLLKLKMVKKSRGGTHPMGCDIHVFVEELKNGTWVYADNYTPMEEDGMKYLSPYEKDSMCRVTRFPSTRNYSLFSTLANVRNAIGAEKLNYISEPRGFPGDSSEIVMREYNYYGTDAHDCSWLRIQEILDFDWSQTALIEYKVPAKIAKQFAKTGDISLISVPNLSWAAERESESVYAEVSYAELIGYKNWYQIYKLTDHPESTRIVFFFDN